MAKSKAMCRGCRDDFYNQNRDGGCWNYDAARIVQAIQVGVWEPPPYSAARAANVLSCYTPDGSVMISVNDQRVTKEESR